VHAEWLLTAVGEQPGFEIIAATHKGRIPGNRTEHWFFARHDFDFPKKEGCVPWNNKLEVARAPGRWTREQFMRSCGWLVFIDER
jgi:hypothetical protein